MCEQEEKSESSCVHSNVTKEDNLEICIDCGVELFSGIDTEQEWRYYGFNDTRFSSDPSRISMRKDEKKNIFKDLDNYGLRGELRDKVNELYLDIVGEDEILRGNTRTGLIFACVLNIFKEMNIPKTTEELSEIIDVSKKTISKGLKMYKLRIANRGKKITNNHSTACDFIPKIMKKFNSSKEHIEKIQQLYLKIHNKSSLLNSSKPQSVACGLIYYYCKSLNKDITCLDFSKIVNLSEITIFKLAKEISGILGNNVKL